MQYPKVIVQWQPTPGYNKLQEVEMLLIKDARPNCVTLALKPDDDESDRLEMEWDAEGDSSDSTFHRPGGFWYEINMYDEPATIIFPKITLVFPETQKKV